MTTKQQRLLLAVMRQLYIKEIQHIRKMYKSDYYHSFSRLEYKHNYTHDGKKGTLYYRLCENQYCAKKIQVFIENK